MPAYPAFGLAKQEQKASAVSGRRGARAQCLSACTGVVDWNNNSRKHTGRGNRFYPLFHWQNESALFFMVAIEFLPCGDFYFFRDLLL